MALRRSTLLHVGVSRVRFFHIQKFLVYVHIGSVAILPVLLPGRVLVTTTPH